MRRLNAPRFPASPEPPSLPQLGNHLKAYSIAKYQPLRSCQLRKASSSLNGIAHFGAPPSQRSLMTEYLLSVSFTLKLQQDGKKQKKQPTISKQTFLKTHKKILKKKTAINNRSRLSKMVAKNDMQVYN